jgi:hypothetical protein
MRGLSSRERLMISLVIAALIGTMFYLFYWTPQTAERDRLQNSLAQQQAELNRLKVLADTREEKEREFQALSQRIDLIEAKLPPEREIPNLIRQLQATATEVGVKLNLLRPGQTQAGPPPPGGTPTASPPPAVTPAPGRPAAPAQPRYQLFRLDLAFEGTFSGLMALMARLEDFPRFVVMRQVSMSPGDLPVLRATINAETFVLPAETRTIAP